MLEERGGGKPESQYSPQKLAVIFHKLLPSIPGLCIPSFHFFHAQPFPSQPNMNTYSGKSSG